MLLRHVNYNGYIERNGSSMVHAHPNNGTKAWVWGQAPNERYWQDFGGGPPTKEFNYNTELQTGVMPTRTLSHLPKCRPRVLSLSLSLRRALTVVGSALSTCDFLVWSRVSGLPDGGG